MHADGSCDREVIGSVAGCLKADWQDGDWQTLTRMFRDPALQMVSFTITEKGYALRDMDGTLLPVVAQDLAGGPDRPRHTLSIAVSLLYQRFLAGGSPIATCLSMWTTSLGKSWTRWSAWTTAPKTAKSSGTAV